MPGQSENMIFDKVQNQIRTLKLGSPGKVLFITLLTTFLSFISQTLIIRNLQQVDVSLFTTAMSFINIVGIFFSAIAISSSSDFASGVVSNKIRILDRNTRDLVALACALALLFIVIGSMGSKIFGFNFFLSFPLASIFISTALLTTAHGRLQGLGKFDRSSAVSLLLVSVNLIFIILLISLGDLNLISILILQSGISILVGAGIHVYWRKEPGIATSPFSTRNLWLTISVVSFWVLANSDLLLAPISLGLTDRTQYSIAANLAKYPLLFAVFINTHMLNTLSRSEGPSRRIAQARGALLQLFFIWLAWLLASFLSSQWLIAVLYGESNQGAGRLLPSAIAITLPLYLLSSAVYLGFYIKSRAIPLYMAITTITVFLVTASFGRSVQHFQILFLTGSCVATLGSYMLAFLELRREPR